MTKKILLMLILSIGILTKLSAQNLNIEQLAYIKIDQISDEQISALESVQVIGEDIFTFCEKLECENQLF